VVVEVEETVPIQNFQRLEMEQDNLEDQVVEEELQFVKLQGQEMLEDLIL
tara:strand:- start:381 stop:530 length:150 start_codon:yes stop_codon:yes gene_type:complete